MIFSRVVPNLKRLGLLTPKVHSAFTELAIIEFEDHGVEADDRELGLAWPMAS